MASFTKRQTKAYLKRVRQYLKEDRKQVLISLIRKQFLEEALKRHKCTTADFGVPAEVLASFLLWPLKFECLPQGIIDDFAAWMKENGRSVFREMMTAVYGRKVYFYYNEGTSVGLHSTMDEYIAFYEDAARTKEIGKTDIFSMPLTVHKAWEYLGPEILDRFPTRIKFVRIK